MYVGTPTAGMRLPQRGGWDSRVGSESFSPPTVAWWRLPGWQAALRLFGALHTVLLSATKGRVGRTMRGGPVLLLTTTGRKSKRSRTLPLCFLKVDDDVVVVAAAAGAETHPGWYFNLTTNPFVSVRIGDAPRAMVARTVRGPDRHRFWDRLVRQYPMLEQYQGRVRRELPVVVLQPEPGSAGI